MRLRQLDVEKAVGAAPGAIVAGGGVCLGGEENF